ncbi:MAG: hypothetical protein K0S07_776 [Chlamydiales bacterium]|jgi:hypothetical protein|nr:hypothetical protein [Chlamydiales bacterium]
MLPITSPIFPKQAALPPSLSGAELPEKQGELFLPSEQMEDALLRNAFEKGLMDELGFLTGAFAALKVTEGMRARFLELFQSPLKLLPAESGPQVPGGLLELLRLFRKEIYSMPSAVLDLKWQLVGSAVLYILGEDCSRLFFEEHLQQTPQWEKKEINDIDVRVTVKAGPHFEEHFHLLLERITDCCQRKAKGVRVNERQQIGDNGLFILATIECEIERPGGSIRCSFDFIVATVLKNKSLFFRRALFFNLDLDRAAHLQIECDQESSERLSCWQPLFDTQLRILNWEAKNYDSIGAGIYLNLISTGHTVFRPAIAEELLEHFLVAEKNFAPARRLENLVKILKKTSAKLSKRPWQSLFKAIHALYYLSKIQGPASLCKTEISLMQKKLQLMLSAEFAQEKSPLFQLLLEGLKSLSLPSFFQVLQTALFIASGSSSIVLRRHAGKPHWQWHIGEGTLLLPLALPLEHLAKKEALAERSFLRQLLPLMLTSPLALSSWAKFEKLQSDLPHLDLAFATLQQPARDLCRDEDPFFCHLGYHVSIASAALGKSFPFDWEMLERVPEALFTPLLLERSDFLDGIALWYQRAHLLQSPQELLNLSIEGVSEETSLASATLKWLQQLAKSTRPELSRFVYSQWQKKSSQWRGPKRAALASALCRSLQRHDPALAMEFFQHILPLLENRSAWQIFCLFLSGGLGKEALKMPLKHLMQRGVQAAKEPLAPFFESPPHFLSLKDAIGGQAFQPIAEAAFSLGWIDLSFLKHVLSQGDHASFQRFSLRIEHGEEEERKNWLLDTKELIEQGAISSSPLIPFFSAILSTWLYKGWMADGEALLSLIAPKDRLQLFKKVLHHLSSPALRYAYPIALFFLRHFKEEEMGEKAFLLKLVDYLQEANSNEGAKLFQKMLERLSLKNDLSLDDPNLAPLWQKLLQKAEHIPFSLIDKIVGTPHFVKSMLTLQQTSGDRQSFDAALFFNLANHALDRLTAIKDSQEQTAFKARLWDQMALMSPALQALAPQKRLVLEKKALLHGQFLNHSSLKQRVQTVLSALQDSTLPHLALSALLESARQEANGGQAAWRDFQKLFQFLLKQENERGLSFPLAELLQFSKLHPELAKEHYALLKIYLTQKPFEKSPTNVATPSIDLETLHHLLAYFQQKKISDPFSDLQQICLFLEKAALLDQKGRELLEISFAILFSQARMNLSLSPHLKENKLQAILQALSLFQPLSSQQKRELFLKSFSDLIEKEKELPLSAIEKLSLTPLLTEERDRLYLIGHIKKKLKSLKGAFWLEQKGHVHFLSKAAYDLMRAKAQPKGHTKGAEKPRPAAKLSLEELSLFNHYLALSYSVPQGSLPQVESAVKALALDMAKLEWMATHNKERDAYLLLTHFPNPDHLSYLSWPGVRGALDILLQATLKVCYVVDASSKVDARPKKGGKKVKKGEGPKPLKLSAPIDDRIVGVALQLLEAFLKKAGGHQGKEMASYLHDLVQFAAAQTAKACDYLPHVSESGPSKKSYRSSLDLFIPFLKKLDQQPSALMDCKHVVTDLIDHLIELARGRPKALLLTSFVSSILDLMELSPFEDPLYMGQTIERLNALLSNGHLEHVEGGKALSKKFLAICKKFYLAYPDLENSWTQSVCYSINEVMNWPLETEDNYFASVIDVTEPDNAEELSDSMSRLALQKTIL